MKRILSLFLVIIICAGLLPQGSVLAAVGDVSVDNDYIEVTSKSDGSAYGINTIKGVPAKRFDDNKPLLYDDDDKFATSYTTVRIKRNNEVRDYIYGSSQGDMVRQPYEHRIDSERSAIVSVWSVDGIEVTQSLVVNQNTSSTQGGYVNIIYSYKNTGADDAQVGIRMLLDTKIADNDGGQFYKNGSEIPITKEVEFAGDSVPEWYSISDSVTYSTTSAYGLLKNSGMRRMPDRVQMAHWFNLANTLWDYNVNGSVNFDDYYNEYRCPDSAISIMFEPELVFPGQELSVDTMYGVGELGEMEVASEYCVMTITQKELLKPNADNTGYANDGEVTLYLTIDNSDPESRQIVDGKLRLVFEDKLLDEELNMTQEPALWVATEKEEDEVISVGTINRGKIKRNIPIKLKARPVYEKLSSNKDASAPDIRYTPAEGYKLRTSIDTRKISFQLTGDGMTIPAVANKIVTLPQLGSGGVDIGFTGIDPKIIYYMGYSYFSVQGIGDNFGALSDKSNWTAYLKNVVTGEIVNIDSFNCSVDTVNTQLGLLVDMEGRLGEFELTIEFKNNLAGKEKHTFSAGDDHIRTSNDEKYRNRGYSVATIARFNGKSNYEMRLFSAAVGEKGIEEQFAEYKEQIEEDDGEILVEARGVFKVNYDTDNGKSAETAAAKPICVSTDSARNNDSVLGFETIPGSDNIKVNRILYYNAMTPLTFKADFDNGKPTAMKVEGDGDLSIINASTIWKHKFMIRFVTSQFYTYEEDDSGMSGSAAPQLQLLGGGWLLQNMGGFIFSLNYGELGCQDGRYTINFSGSVSFPLGMNKSKDDTAGTGSGSTGSGAAPANAASGASQSGSGNAGSGASADAKKLFKEGNGSTNALGSFGDGGSLGVSIDSILFGEHENRNDENKIETGFVGIAANVQLELPKSVFPAGGKQNNDSTLSNGAAAANPTGSRRVLAGSHRATTAAGQNQNAANAAGKNKGKLSGFSLGASFNTYEFNAGVDLGIGIGPISSAFRMSLAETNNGKICLDTIYLEIKGFVVPIVPGITNFIGLGGGISDLASSINYKGDARPPVTISVMAAIDIVSAMALQADLSVSGNGVTFSVTGAPKGFEQIKFVAKGEFDWTTGFSMRLSGTVDIFSGVVLGNVSLGFTTSPEFFMMGKISGSLNIPGLGKLAGVTLAITNNFIAGGVRVLIFSGGFVYYYDTKNFRLLRGSEVDEIDDIDLDSPEMEEDDSPTSGHTFLEVIEVPIGDGSVQLMGIGAGAQIVGSTIDSVVSTTYASPMLLTAGTNFTTDVTDEMISGNDVVMRVYYDGDVPPELEVTGPGGSYPTVLYDFNKTQEENNLAGANMLRSEKTDKDTGAVRKYVYVNITNPDLSSGEWSVRSTNGVEISDYTVLTVPTVTPRLSIDRAELSGTQLDAEWTAEDNAQVSLALVPCTADGKPVIESFTDDDGNLIENEHPGYIIAQAKGSGAEKIEVNIPSGTYIVRADAIMNSSAFVSTYTDTPIVYVNPNTLAAPANVTAFAGGDGRLDVTADVPENATGVQFDVYRRRADGSEELLPAIGGYVGDYDGSGKIASYFKGENSIVDDNGAVKSTSAIVPGETYFVKARAVNVNEGSGYYNSPQVTSADVNVPVPTPPEVSVKVISYDAKSKTDEKNIPYLQAKGSNVLIEYEITNFGTEPNDEVTVRFDIDEKQYGEEIVNNAANGAKGYAAFKLSDGEHFVDVVFINKAGDVTVETRKLSVDTIPADIKIESPQNGSLFDPAEGIKVKLTTDDGATIDIYLDGEQVVTGDVVTYKKEADGAGSTSYSTVYEKTVEVENPGYSHELMIRATDANGNKTEHIATVVNKNTSKIGGIKILASKSEGSDATELTAIGLDKDGKELGLKIAKNRFNWTLLSDPSEASLFVSDGNSSTVVMQNTASPFTVRAQLSLGEGAYLTDIYDSGIVGEQRQSEDGTNTDDNKPTGGGSSGGSSSDGINRGGLPAEVIALMNQIKASMGQNAEVTANKMYSGVDLVVKQSDNTAYISGGDIAAEDYLVVGTDSDIGGYSAQLGEGCDFRSDIIEARSVKGTGNMLIDIKAAGAADVNNLGIYKYASSIGKWLYVGGVFDASRDMLSLENAEDGRYAVIENPQMGELRFCDIDTSWAQLYIRSLCYAGFVDGYIENGERYFKPKNEVTRGEFVKLLASVTGLSTEGADASVFADSDSIPAWAAPYAAAAYNAGWFAGVKTDRGAEARLSERITRQDAMTLVYRVFFGNKAASGVIAFGDSSEVSEYAQNAVSYLTENGVVAGFEDNTLRPGSFLLREQIAKILHTAALK